MCGLIYLGTKIIFLKKRLAKLYCRRDFYSEEKEVAEKRKEINEWKLLYQYFYQNKLAYDDIGGGEETKQWAGEGRG